MNEKALALILWLAGYRDSCARALIRRKELKMVTDELQGLMGIQRYVGC
jgi:hypothetical protein